MSKGIQLRGNYDDTKSVVFCTDPRGNEIAVRPKQFLASGPSDRVLGAVAEIAAELEVGLESYVIANEDLKGAEGKGETLRGTWLAYSIAGTTDVVRVVRGLKDRGIPAQPNHVYFVDSQPAHSTSSFNPNLFAPNLFAPNLFAPNLFAPNLFAPNLFAPNLFAPNLFAGGGGAGCCCPRGLSDGETRPVPPHLAEPAEPLDSYDGPYNKDAKVQIHVIDVAFDSSSPNVDINNDNWLDPVTGHGMFVADVLERSAEMAVDHHGVADPLGSIDDVELALSLRAVAGIARSDSRTLKVLNLSLSGYTYNDEPTQMLADEVKAMIEDNWLIVASAGNNASCRLAWPAALPNVVAVGAYGDCGPASFSSYGPWVDASGPGVNTLGQFPSTTIGLPGDLIVEADEDGNVLRKSDIHTSGWARWSGTSFAAPLVAGRLAKALKDTGDVDAAIATVLNDPDAGRLPYFGTLIT